MTSTGEKQMKTILKITTIAIVLILTIIVDIPILPVELVADADAIMGVRRRTRRRTAVVVGSTTAAATASAEASQQQAAAAPQQTAPAQQQAAPAQTSSGVPVGTVASALPGGCKAVTVSDTQYQDCGGSFYKTAFQGNNLVYVVVERPI
jgi:hypothetical protein